MWHAANAKTGQGIWLKNSDGLGMEISFVCQTGALDAVAF